MIRFIIKKKIIENSLFMNKLCFNIVKHIQMHTAGGMSAESGSDVRVAAYRLAVT